MAAFLKIGDIKGEFASNVSFTYREDGANRFTTGGGGDSLTDAGLGNNSFHQGADVWTNGTATSVKKALHSDYNSQEAVKEVGWWTVDGADFRAIQQDPLTKGGQEGEELVSDYWSPTPSCSIDETCTPTCALGFADDALVQQVNGTIGYEMQAGMGISPNAKSHTIGTIAAYNVMGSGVPVENYCTGYCFDGGSAEQENIFALANMQLRSDNRF